MKLYCVRHCEANSADVDSLRGLTETGLEDAQKIANHMKQQAVVIPHIIHSGKLRAKQTAEVIFSSVDGDELTESPLLLDDQADINILLEDIVSWQQDTMLVGHMPYMANLVSALVMDIGDNMHLVTYAPGTVVCLKRMSEGRWIIDWVLKPENLR